MSAERRPKQRPTRIVALTKESRRVTIEQLPLCLLAAQLARLLKQLVR